jgi:K+-transporting ATPase ATPase C chain
MTLSLAFLLCGIYPASVWIIGKTFFPERASGGIIYIEGKPRGADLIGQNFSKPEYFQGRPSSAGQNGYDAANSSGSNLGPTHKKLAGRLASDIQRILKENPHLSRGQIPTNWVTASGSGLDPHISPESAQAQIVRVAQARKIKPEILRNFIEKHTQGPQLGVLGEPSVNILALNLDLDEWSKQQLH